MTYVFCPHPFFRHVIFSILNILPFQVTRSDFATFCSKNHNFIQDEDNTIGNVRHDVENGYERNIINMKEEANIMSVKGTVRGVKNRVKTGIATFLQDQKKKVSRRPRNI